MARDDAGLFVASERDPTDVEPAESTLDGGGSLALPTLRVGIDGLLPPWFGDNEPLVTWPAARFAPDGHLYMAHGGVVYRTTGAF